MQFLELETPGDSTGLILVVWSVAGGDSRRIIPEQVLSAGALRIVVVEIVAEGHKYFYY